MNIDDYKVLLLDTVKYGISDYNLQGIINELREANRATYNKKETNRVLLNSEASKYDRVQKCMNEDDGTFYYFEHMEFIKGYRYAMYYNCNLDNVDNISNEYTNINDFVALGCGCNLDLKKPIYYTTKNKIMIKFSKQLRIYNAEEEHTHNIRYSNIWIFHKNINILEVRFDKLDFNKDDNFYEKTIAPQLSKIIKDFKVKPNHIHFSSTIKYILENKKEEVVEIAQFLGLRRNSTAKLKVGKDLVMPFLGDLEILLEDPENINIFNKNHDTEMCLNVINNYIDNVKKNAIYKTRLISWINLEEEKIDVNIIFGYRDKDYDIYNFYDPKKTKMELMNYVIDYITKIQKNISLN